MPETDPGAREAGTRDARARDDGPPAVRAARRLLEALVELGLRDIVLAPGSRSAPLAYAAAALADSGRVELHVRIDERDAGFLALGLARGTALPHGSGDHGSPAPVAIVTTSGTAVANLHPAVLEAHHAGVPLILLTADRPHELRGTGANQTTDQPGMFASAMRLAVDVPAPGADLGSGLPGSAPTDLDHLAARAVDAALGWRSADPGPVHLNVSYRDPLVPGAAATTGAPDAPARRTPVVVPARRGPVDLPAAVRPRVSRTVVVAGDRAGRVARDVAEAQGWPLLAEPSSGACGGPNLVAAHRLVLGVLGEEVERAIVFGRPTLSRPVQSLLAHHEVIVVAPGGGPWQDAARHAAVVLPGVPDVWGAPAGDTADVAAHDDTADAAWLARWRDASRSARACVEAEARRTDAEPSTLTGLQVAQVLARVSTPDDVIVVGSSSPVRDLDLVAGWSEPPTVVASRGLAGIDGMVSTAVGVAIASQRGGPAGGRVRAYIGDLTFLHDVGGLLAVSGEARPALQVVVANDGGGSIFSTLEPGARAAAGGTDGDEARRFERVFATPHDVNLAALCTAYGAEHVRAKDVRSLVAALESPPPQGIQVVEVAVDRAGRRDRETLVARAVRAAIED